MRRDPNSHDFDTSLNTILKSLPSPSSVTPVAAPIQNISLQEQLNPHVFPSLLLCLVQSHKSYQRFVLYSIDGQLQVSSFLSRLDLKLLVLPFRSPSQGLRLLRQEEGFWDYELGR